jgi:DNA-binding winged helix-turn-helix (wHTH) protein/TolB-like protein/Flp pilus assembly protein TadD
MYEFDGFRLDTVRRQLRDPHGELVALMPKAMDTLVYLVEHAGDTIDKEVLLRAVWRETIVEENNLTQNVSALRKALGERAGEHRFIVTIPGRGYRFVAAVHRVEALPPDAARTEDPPPAAIAPIETPRRPLLSRPIVYLGLALVLVLGTVTWFLASSRRDQAIPQTIAVLPFKPVVATQRNEAIELGMADSLITELSRSTALIVRPLTATRRYSDIDQDALVAGRDLDVDAVLDGTIQMADGRVRASARLLRVRDGRQLWAGKFDDRSADFFAMQDAMAERVASALATRLVATRPRTTDDLRAYELYMLGRLHAMRLVMSEVRTALGYFEQAIIQDPSYALAYAGISEAMRSLALSNDVPAAEITPRAKIAIERAIELDPNLPEALMARGMFAFMFEWDWRAAEAYLSKAVELMPNNSEARIYLAHLYSNLARRDEALTQARKARELNPISPLIASLEGQFLGHQGQHDEAIRRLQEAVRIEPRLWLTHHLLANELIDAAKYEEALTASALAKKLSPLQTYSNVLDAIALARLKREPEARDILTKLTEASRTTYVPPTHLAMIHAALNEPTAAFDALNAALEARDPRLAFLKIDPKWDSLRSDPRFHELLKKVGF